MRNDAGRRQKVRVHRQASLVHGHRRRDQAAVVTTRRSATAGCTHTSLSGRLLASSSLVAKSGVVSARLASAAGLAARTRAKEHIVAGGALSTSSPRERSTSASYRHAATRCATAAAYSAATRTCTCGRASARTAGQVVAWARARYASHASRDMGLARVRGDGEKRAVHRSARDPGGGGHVAGGSCTTRLCVRRKTNAIAGSNERQTGLTSRRAFADVDVRMTTRIMAAGARLREARRVAVVVI